jgi:hypothetical protein
MNTPITLADIRAALRAGYNVANGWVVLYGDVILRGTYVTKAAAVRAMVRQHKLQLGATSAPNVASRA